MKISLFGSAVKCELWADLFESLKETDLEYEVVFAGFLDPTLVSEITPLYPNLTYIHTANIKVAQCFELARRKCIGEIVGWISDDCTFEPHALDKIYQFINQPKSLTWPKFDVISVQINDPECENNNLNDQRFFSRNVNTPLDPNVGFMKREYLQFLGGIDSRYVFGRFEMDIGMRVFEEGGRIIPYEGTTVQISHTDKRWHINNDWSGINEDSEQIENSWVIGGYKPLEKPLIIFQKGQPEIYYPITNREVTKVRNDKFVGYPEELSTTVSFGQKGRFV